MSLHHVVRGLGSQLPSESLSLNADSIVCSAIMLCLAALVSYTFTISYNELSKCHSNGTVEVYCIH